jgi:predicted RNA binding protein YcfA (HicA-like mRNA interferase family)
MKPQKLLKKALSGSKNIRFDEFVALIMAFGFTLRRVSGSHHIFKHPEVSDLLSVQPSKDSKAKPYQIHQLIALVEEYNLTLSDEDAEDEETARS